MRVPALPANLPLGTDSCRGYGSKSVTATVARPLNLSTYATYERPGLKLQTPRFKYRMAYELSGCVRSLNISLAAKRENWRAARRFGYRIDLFCVLESCGPAADDVIERRMVDNFIHAFRRASSANDEVVNCTLWPRGTGILDAAGHLRSEYRMTHPDFPYFRRSGFGKNPAFVGHVLANMYKHKVQSQLHRESGRVYDVVWRTRPDFVSTGFESALRAMPTAHDVYFVTQHCFVASTPNKSHIEAHGHTDIELLLTGSAALHHGQLFDETAKLYANGWSFAPEVLLTQHMHEGRFKSQVLWNAELFRCSSHCFGLETPCRLFPPSRRSRTCVFVNGAVAPT